MLAQALSSLSSILGDEISARESAELEERQELFNIDEIRGDVRDAVADVCPEATTAAQGTRGCSWPGDAEAQVKVQPGGREIQFFLKGRREYGTEVLRGMEWESLEEVLGLGMEDVHLTYMGRMVLGKDSLAEAGILDNGTVNICWRLRGGSREDVPGHWTRGHCNALRCWPARKRCYRCGELRMDAPVVVPARVTGPLGKNQPPPKRNAPPMFSVKQQQQQQNRWVSQKQTKQTTGPTWVRSRLVQRWQNTRSWQHL